MSAVVEAVSDVFEPVVEFVGDVAETVVDAASDVVTFVGDTAEAVVQGALDDPLGTIIKVGTAIYAPYLLPVVNASIVVANGGDIGDALTTAALTYAGQAVGGEMVGAMEGTWAGDALAAASEATGIETLATDVARGAGTAATQTAAGIAQGQDVGDALTRGLTSGVGTTVGRIVGGEADTGSNIADRLIGTGVGAATTASLRGGDAETAAENAIAQNILGGGLNYAGNQLKDVLPSKQDLMDLLPTSTENVSGTAQIAGMAGSDVELTPTESAIKQIIDSSRVTMTDPVTGEEVKVEQTPEEKSNLDNLIAALYPEAKADEVKKVDTEGNAFDSSGKKLGDAEQLGLVLGTDSAGNPAWITASGEVISATKSADPYAEGYGGETGVDYTKLTSANTPTTANQLVSEAEGDFPEQIINNPDGSTTVIETDGTSRTFNVDGSVTLYNAEGGQSQEFSAKEGEGYDGTNGVNYNAAKTDDTLGNLASSLLSGVTGGSQSGTRTGSTGGGRVLNATNVGLAGGAAALIGGAAAAAGGGGSTTDAGTVPNSTLSWNPSDPMAVSQGRAYGQQFLNPVYAAEGGLMSLNNPMQGQMPYMQPQQNQYGQMQPQYVQPTMIPNNYTPNEPSAFSQEYSNSPSKNQDPNNSVNMYSAGGMPIAMNAGGISSLGGYSDGGRLLKGPGDGMSDNIPATIAGKQPARLANEEFVVPADVVSHLGNGSSEAGAKVLYAMMERVRKARTGNSKQGKQIQPEKYMPKVRK